ncbi:MAG TPA: RNA polymerase sigma factor [Naasia sp.]|jgi:RNA polymerase sigma-70 factor (ECF subfamily)
MRDDLGDETGVWDRALSGDGGAFASLFRVHQARVHRRALSLLDRVHDAEDVTSAVFFELWRKRASVRLVGGSVLPWLLVTTVHLARNHRRGVLRYRRLITSLPRSDSPDAEAVAVDNLSNAMLGLRLADAIALLSNDDGALLVLTALEGMTTADAAVALGIRPGTARMRLQRARQKLQAALNDERLPVTPALSEGER